MANRGPRSHEISVFVFKKMPNNVVASHSFIVRTALSTTLVIFLFVFKKMPNNVVTSHSLIVRTALVNDPSEIFVCLQKYARQ